MSGAFGAATRSDPIARRCVGGHDPDLPTGRVRHRIPARRFVLIEHTTPVRTRKRP